LTLRWHISHGEVHRDAVSDSFQHMLTWNVWRKKHQLEHGLARPKARERVGRSVLSHDCIYVHTGIDECLLELSFECQL
jgi:hypothetical protein